MSELNVSEAPAVKVSQNAAAIKKMGEEIEMRVINSISALEEGGLKLPEGYNYANAIKYAWLKLQGTEDKGGANVLDTCTKASIANAILAMVLKGETLLYNHGYFIAYGDKLTYFEDYRGKLMRAVRDTQVADVNAQVIYEGDNFVYEVDSNGRYQFVKHETKMENIDISKIKGGYAIITYKDGSKRMEIMTIAQIKTAWMQGATKGNSMAHTKFTDQMAMRTLYNRAVKIDLGKCSETVTEPGDDDEQDVQERRREAVQTAIEDFRDVTDFEEVKDESEKAAEAPEAAPEQPAEPERKNGKAKKDCPI